MKIAKSPLPISKTLRGFAVEIPDEIQSVEAINRYLLQCEVALGTDVFLFRKKEQGLGILVECSLGRSPNNQIELPSLEENTLTLEQGRMHYIQPS